MVRTWNIHGRYVLRFPYFAPPVHGWPMPVPVWLLSLRPAIAIVVRIGTARHLRGWRTLRTVDPRCWRCTDGYPRWLVRGVLPACRHRDRDDQSRGQPHSPWATSTHRPKTRCRRSTRRGPPARRRHRGRSRWWSRICMLPRPSARSCARRVLCRKGLHSVLPARVPVTLRREHVDAVGWREPVLPPGSLGGVGPDPGSVESPGGALVRV